MFAAKGKKVRDIKVKVVKLYYYFCVVGRPRVSGNYSDNFAVDFIADSRSNKHVFTFI